MTAPRRPGPGLRRELVGSGWITSIGALVLAVGPLLAGCTRHADIRDEPDASDIQEMPQLDAGTIPELDSGLGTDAYPPCGDRPEGDCRGPVDFPCDFESWATQTAVSCQKATGCKTNGWVEVTMGATGCVEVIGMDQPNDDIVACLLAEFGSVRCPCKEVSLSYFFGVENKGTCP